MTIAEEIEDTSQMVLDASALLRGFGATELAQELLVRGERLKEVASEVEEMEFGSKVNAAVTKGRAALLNR